MKRLFGVVVMISLLMSCKINVQASETAMQDGIEINIWTEKEEYNSTEDVEVEITVKNHNGYAVDGLSLEMTLPSGLEIKNESLMEVSLQWLVDLVAPTETEGLSAENMSIKGGEERIFRGELIYLDSLQEGTNAKGDSVTIVLVGLCVVLVIAIVVLLVVLIAPRKKRDRMICLLLCVGVAMSMLPMRVLAADEARERMVVSKKIYIDDEEYIIKAEVSYFLVEEQLCTIAFDTDGGTVIESQVINNGELLVQPDIPEKEGFVFIGWYGDEECTIEYDFTQPVKRSCTVYARWLNIADKTDSDGDGLTDALEEFYGTNFRMADSDEDGLNDYVEVVVLQYNPLITDTDGNGVGDGDEDCDGDGLNNVYEVSMSTNPANDDSDEDGLSDREEIDDWGTNPIINDTDMDGAGDKWEAVHGFNPLEYNDTFVTEVKANGNVTEVGVVATVSMEGTGKQAESLSVVPVTAEEEPLLSSDIPGYMGVAYDISASEKDMNATLTFEYDTSMGTISESFQPRIYLFDDAKGRLQELENQDVSEGKVSVHITQASKCILLNKVEFDKVWEQEFKRPFISEEGKDATLDVMFVIDYSASMVDNDPNQMFKQVSAEFINKLRSGQDKTGAVQFIREAYWVSRLTLEKERVIEAINTITYDDGYQWDSGTDGSAGLHLALEELEQSDSKYQFIIFITDGEDNGYFYSYDELIERALQKSIVIYTIGMGSADEELLTRVAEGTGGKYYHATAGVSLDDLANLDDVYGEIEAETVDLTTDSNGDAIPDYYNELIKQGILVLSNGSTAFVGKDFNFDANGNPGYDYDGDGIKNGEELVIVQEGNVVYMQMKSNPLEKDTDKDGYSDADDANPMVWDVSYRDLALLSHAVYENYNAGTVLSETDKTLKSNKKEVAGTLKEMVGWKVLLTFYNPVTGFEAAAYAKDNNLVLATRGSESHDIADIVQDWVIADAIGYILGLNAQLPAMEEFVSMAVKMYGHEYENIYVTGHSLGGYLALMASSQLVKHGMEDKIRKVVTFNGLGMNYCGGTFIGTILDRDDYDNFERINGKLKHYRTDNDVVSLIGYTPGDKVSIERSKTIDWRNIVDGHNLFTFAEHFSNENRKPQYDNFESYGLRDEWSTMFGK